jgi:transcriptional regulator
MYVPAHFAEARNEEIVRIVHEHPFGTLVTHAADGLDANHLPFEFDPAAGPHGRLTGHVARANDVWSKLRDGDQVLVIFGANDAYVSPNWYPSKHEAHRQVPTWNYQVVHLHGTIRILDDVRWLRGLVARLTRTHETRMAEERPWKMGDSDPAFIDDLLTKIVGIEVDVTQIVAKSKLSQNKEERDRMGAADGLERHDGTETARAMREAG